LKFEVSDQQYEIDLSPERLMGDELLLIDSELPAGWAMRWATEDLGVRDIIVLTYLAARRAGDTRAYDEFVKTIAPLTFKIVRPESPDAPPADSLGAKVRTRKQAATSA
jgi:hypothetical protein